MSFNAFLLVSVLGAAVAAQSAFSDILAHPAIRYAPSNADPIASLQQALAKGSVRVEGADPRAYLRALLEALDISERSQMLVFSKTSLQSPLIEAANPRAIYFSDTVSVAYVPGGIIEIASQDPDQAVQFYTVDPRGGAPAITTGRDCLRCHHSYRTAFIPGMIEPMTHRRPLEQRWGGWYVTGNLGSVRHFGNVDLNATDSTERDFNWPSLEGRLATGKYLSPYSDAVALLVFEHQMHMMNLLTKANWDARLAAAEPSREASETLQADIDAVVDYMLFVDEAPLPSPITGTAGFEEEFSGRGPRDPRGRSLHQLDLRTRLMKYPCSYVIYSTQFDHLPPAVKTRVYTRLSAVLSGADRSRRYAHLSRVDRQAIVEILRATKPDLPAAFGRPSRRAA